MAASTLVPGDIVLLEAGNQIPADLRLLEIAQLQVDESALTGESVTTAKDPRVLPADGVHALGDRLNMAFKGTTGTHGRARSLVVATGMSTELGKVAQLLDHEDRSTPLQRRLAAFGKRATRWISKWYGTNWGIPTSVRPASICTRRTIPAMTPLQLCIELDGTHPETCRHPGRQKGA